VSVRQLVRQLVRQSALQLVLVCNHILQEVPANTKYSNPSTCHQSSHSCTRNSQIRRRTAQSRQYNKHPDTWVGVQHAHLCNFPSLSHTLHQCTNQMFRRHTPFVVQFPHTCPLRDHMPPLNTSRLPCKFRPFHSIHQSFR